MHGENKYQRKQRNAVSNSSILGRQNGQGDFSKQVISKPGIKVINSLTLISFTKSSVKL